MLFSNVSCKLDNSLHSFHFSFNVNIKVLFFDLREQEEMDRTRISSVRIFWDVVFEGLINIFCQERRIRGLDE
jgi:hypothetical protein